jgi:hypothetical protein
MTIDYTQGSPQPPRNWWSRNWKWVVPVGCLLPLLVMGGCVAGLFFIVFEAIRHTEVYTESVSRAQANPEVRARLGEPIEPRWWITGNVNAANDGGDANVSIPIRGPKRSASIHVVATKNRGRWEYQTMDVEIGNDTINLLTPPISPGESSGTAPPAD